MGFLKPKPDYVKLDDPEFKPGSKNGHLSEPRPELETVYRPMDEPLLPIWTGDNVTIGQFKDVFRKGPPPVPETAPKSGRDVDISYIQAPVRDGTLVELKLWRSTRPRGNAALVLRMHGGGWTVGTHETEETENLYLAMLPDVVVVSVDYRMAPGFPFPYALNDCFDILEWCKANASRLDINPEKVILCGCSAGGNLAATLSIKCRDEGVSGIIGQVLSIPVTCHPKLFDRVPGKEKYELLSYVHNANAPLLDTVRMEFFWDCYVGKNPDPDVLHSPLLCSDLRGLPPAIVLIAGVDPLRDEGIAYAQALEAAGVPTELHTYKGLPHGFYVAATLKDAVDYFEKVVNFVKRCAAKDPRASI